MIGKQPPWVEGCGFDRWLSVAVPSLGSQLRRLEFDTAVVDGAGARNAADIHRTKQCYPTIGIQRAVKIHNVDTCLCDS